MKIKIEMEIKSCWECPFAREVREMGYNATECSKLGVYNSIPNKGFRKDCPFIKSNKNNA
jgi:hypothetical protein